MIWVSVTSNQGVNMLFLYNIHCIKLHYQNFAFRNFSLHFPSATPSEFSQTDSSREKIDSILQKTQHTLLSLTDASPSDELQIVFAERRVHSEVRKAYEATTDAPVVDISVSFDGKWLTRGYTSLIGIVCVVDILIGYVIDFEVMCKVCPRCSVSKSELGESSAEYGIWFEGHRKDCDINHYGASTLMEMEAALSSGEDHKHWDFVIPPYCLMGIVKSSITLQKKMCMGTSSR
ncbi:uncharacterized protein TNCV_4997891 [Trichonephila clavipes]|nr:uncharacterized protein TNCV_4997891 [Trichonephila clavipes]